MGGVPGNGTPDVHGAMRGAWRGITGSRKYRGRFSKNLEANQVPPEIGMTIVVVVVVVVVVVLFSLHICKSQRFNASF